MTQLVKMKQHIKTIETIKKVTSAMRMIARSFYGTLNNQKSHIKLYEENITAIFSNIILMNPNWSSFALKPHSTIENKKLYIIIGSQKGLCGNFNIPIINWITKNNHILTAKNVDCVIIGKKIIDSIASFKINPIMQYDTIKSHKIAIFTKHIIQKITKSNDNYSHVIIISKQPKNFFTTHLKESIIIPLKSPDIKLTNTSINNNFHTASNHTEQYITTIAQHYCSFLIYKTIHESLLGEQSSRFIAMDNATRNANTFLETMKLQYNKIRQAKITKELTELAANFCHYEL